MIIILFLFLFLFIPNVYAQQGVFLREDCTTLSPITNKTFCFELTNGALKRWNGTSWVHTNLSGLLTAADLDMTSNFTWEGQNDHLKTVGSRNSGGPPGAGSCTAPGWDYIDTTNERVYVCPKAANENPVEIGTYGDSFVIDSDGTNTAQATGADTRTIARARGQVREIEVFQGNTTFTNQPSNDGIEVLSSSSSDVSQTVTIYGTTNGGDTSQITVETVTLTGQTPVSTSKTDWANVIAVSKSASTVGTVTIREASADQTITTMGPSVLRQAYAADANDNRSYNFFKTVPSIPSEAQGDVLFHNGSTWTRLAAGTSGQYLKTQGSGANPKWDNIDPTLPTNVVIVEEFMWARSGTAQQDQLGKNWDFADGQGVGNFALQAATANHPGIIRVTSGSTAADFSALINVPSGGGNFQFNNLAGTTGWTAYFVFKINSTSNQRNYVGFTNANAALPSNLIGIRADVTIDASNFDFVCRNGGTESTLNAVALDTNWHTVKMRVDSANSVIFNIDGGADQTISSNCPTANLLAAISAGSNGTTGGTIDIDFFSFKMTVTR